RAYSVRFSTPYDSVGYRSLLEAALDMAALAAERDSLYADGWALRGAVLQHLAQIHTDPGRIDRLLQESERALRRAIHLDPLHQSAWRGLADLLFASGRYGEAYVAARRAYQIDPYDAHVVRGILNRLFATALELGEDDQAQGWCHEGRRRFVEDLPFLYCLLALHAWGDGVDADPAALR